MQNKITPDQIIKFLIQKLDEGAGAIGEDEIIEHFGESHSPEIQNLIKELDERKLYVSKEKLDEFFDENNFKSSFYSIFPPCPPGPQKAT